MCSLPRIGYWKRLTGSFFKVHCKYLQACIYLEMEAMMIINNLLDLRVYGLFSVRCEYFIRACTSALLNSTSELDEKGEEFALYVQLTLTARCTLRSDD